MSANWAPAGFQLDKSYEYTDEHGAYLFEHRRYRSAVPRMRGKTFSYFDRTTQRHRKPADADRWLRAGLFIGRKVRRTPTHCGPPAYRQRRSIRALVSALPSRPRGCGTPAV
jgi:hypothetical protein